jgi:3-oxoacyl-[acyl-carrier-protein] synthase III
LPSVRFYREVEERKMTAKTASGWETEWKKRVPALVVSSGSLIGSHTVPSEEVDRTFAMPIGKLRKRAGIETIAYASDGENELTLGASSLEDALRCASCGAQELDWIIATSETHHDYPALAAQLHSRLVARENCGALDIGGACLGLLNALAVAQSLIGSGAAKTVAVVTADMHSRVLTPARVVGEFGGLFGDGASAFLLRREEDVHDCPGYRLGDFLFGCAGQYAAAICVAPKRDGGLDVKFDGEALSRAAITRMERVIAAVEARSGISRRSVGSFATHQPNPRLLALLAKHCGVSPGTFPPICRTSGNLGSSMCGAALHAALQNAANEESRQRKPIFLVSLGPGLLFGGTWLTPG